MIGQEVFSSPPRVSGERTVGSCGRFIVCLWLLIVVSTSTLESAELELKPRATLPDALGIVTLQARDAAIHGTQMHYEESPLKNCLGYWFKTEDWAEWRFEITHPGSFEVEILQGCGQGQGGSEVNVEVSGQVITFLVEETGHFQIFLPRKVGRVTFPKAATYLLALKPQKKTADAIMDVRQVRL